MSDNNENLNKSLPASGGGVWWRPAVQVFTEISTWIAFPVILAAFGGTWLDKHYGTKPTWLLICVVVAFLVSAYGIVKTVRKYTERLKKQTDK